MAKARARHGGYIFQRPGSANWYVKLRSPGEKRKEESLGTPDKLKAEVKAATMIAEHKAKLLAARPRFDTVWKHALEPGREHAGPDGGKIVATDEQLIHIGGNGSVLKIEPNGGRALQLVSNSENVGPSNWRFAAAYLNADGSQKFDKAARPVVTAKTGDDMVLETYIKHAGLTGYVEKEARNVWALFRRLTNNKSLKDCNRDDGRLLVQHFEAQGLKSKTIEKKIAWPNAAVNFAIKEHRHKTVNPFAAIAPDRKDGVRRKPLSAADIKIIKAKLSRLDKNDQLLIRLLASTGMRIAEAFEIEGEEEKERGCRFAMVGHKTEQSLRRVPFPSAVLSYLPSRIKGPLFNRDAKDPADAASKRLNKFLREECGITDPAKVIHSFRHRAQDRLRAAECPADIRHALLGHEEKSVAEGYGEGFSVPQLKKWIDKIGF